MTERSTIEISVLAETASALADERRLAAVGHLVDRLVNPGQDDPLLAVFERTEAAAQSAGLTEADVAAELAAYNAERRT